MNDPAQYEPFVLKQYRCFSLFLAANQHYLGQAYAWLSREGSMQRLSQLTHEELLELQTIAQEYEEALEGLWQPDHFNYAWLGNLFHEHDGHGHMHFIPRYKESRNFAGMTFVDGRWGKNYADSEELTLSDDKLFLIRDALRERLVSGTE